MMAQSIDQYISLYKSQREAICGHSNQVQNQVRHRAFEALQSIGLPRKKDERYRYTDMESVLRPDLGLNINRLKIPVDPYEAFRCDVPNLSTWLFFVVNDGFSAHNPKREDLEREGITVCSLGEAAEKYGDIVERHYAKGAQVEKDGITALNTMLAQDGLFVYVRKNAKPTKAVQVVNILRSDVPLMANRRVLIVVEEGAKARLLFCDHAVDDRDFLATEVTEAFLGDGAELEIYSLEETHDKCTRISNAYMEVGKGAHLTYDLITLHNGMTRNQADIVFHGEHGECTLNGCVIADKTEHVDNNTLIHHATPQCKSQELFKYVLQDEAVGAFAGKILVSPGAWGTESQERNNNILESLQARMYTQPMLEIYADDVQCSHGSTVGALQEDALFYMRQRGIPEKEARLLLASAFVYEVIDTIALEPLRDRLKYLVDKRFRGELKKCSSCRLCK